MWTNGLFLNKTILIQYSSCLTLIPTPLYLPFNLLTSIEMRLEDISLVDPTAKLPLSGSLVS